MPILPRLPLALHPVGRISQHQIHPLSAYKLVNVLRLRSVPAHQPMTAKLYYLSVLHNITLLSINFGGQLLFSDCPPLFANYFNASYNTLKYCGSYSNIPSITSAGNGGVTNM